MYIQSLFYPFLKGQDDLGATGRLLIVVSQKRVEMPSAEILKDLKKTVDTMNALIEKGATVALLDRQWVPGEGNRWVYRGSSREIPNEYALWLGKSIRQIVFEGVSPKNVFSPSFKLYYRSITNDGRHARTVIVQG